jgi:hypothetical protein
LAKELKRTKSSGTPPSGIAEANLFDPELTDQLWEEVALDVGGDEGAEVPPQWMASTDMRNAILAFLASDRAQEELQRLKAEVEIFTHWVIDCLTSVIDLISGCEGLWSTPSWHYCWGPDVNK